MWAINGAMVIRPLTAEELERHPEHATPQYQGYHDARALIRKVRAFGDAPFGEYRELLGRPWPESVMRDANAGPSILKVFGMSK